MAPTTPHFPLSRLSGALRITGAAGRHEHDRALPRSTRVDGRRHGDGAVQPLAALGLLDRADHQPLRVDAVHARSHDRVPRHHIGEIRDEVHAQPGRPSISSPTTRPPARVRSVQAPTAAARSMSSWTRAACAATGPMTRPTSPSARSPPCRPARHRACRGRWSPSAGRDSGCRR